MLWWQGVPVHNSVKLNIAENDAGGANEWFLSNQKNFNEKKCNNYIITSLIA